MRGLKTLASEFPYFPEFYIPASQILNSRTLGRDGGFCDFLLLRLCACDFENIDCISIGSLH